MSVRKPYAAYPGYVASRRSGPPAAEPDGKAGWVVLVDSTLRENVAATDDFAPGFGRWRVVCMTHGDSKSCQSEKQAREAMAAGSRRWCVDCNPGQWILTFAEAQALYQGASSIVKTANRDPHLSSAIYKFRKAIQSVGGSASRANAAFADLGDAFRVHGEVDP